MKIDELRRLVGQPTWKDPAEQQQTMEARLQTRGLAWSNLYQEMEMSSRFVDTHRDVTYVSGTVALHSHSFYEILYCESDPGMEYLVGTERYALRRGDVIVIPPGISHRPILPERLEEPYRRVVLWLAEEFVEQAILPAVEFDRPREEWRFLLRTAGTSQERAVEEHFAAGVREAEAREPGWQAYAAGNTMVLLTLLLRMLEERNAPLVRAEQPELLDRVMAYIEENLAGQITLADTARQFWVSESTISQTFRQRMGVSFYRCVTQRRLIAAKSLILQGRPLGEINEQVGFADYSTFYRAFKGEFGVSPRQFRQLREGGQAS